MYLMEELKQFSKWASVVAIFTIIYGALSAIGGIFAFVIGAIPGIIMIFVGVKLLNAKKQADELVELNTTDEVKMQALFNNLTSYFKLQGILFIVALAFSIIGFIVMITISASIMQSIPQF